MRRRLVLLLLLSRHQHHTNRHWHRLCGFHTCSSSRSSSSDDLLTRQLRQQGSLPAVPIVCGQTASGKTALSVAVAHELQQRWGGSGMKRACVISCDAAQVYRGMDIGTAKVQQDHFHLWVAPPHLHALKKHNVVVARFVSMRSAALGTT